ncbi:hypothetical protein [Candidatus Poriferisocius sp.]|uniref:hypothetical protein n=1 Tax=Candidatus Poriferisocius sp. TaxID=3101276 RepID=UPI003B02763D
MFELARTPSRGRGAVARVVVAFALLVVLLAQPAAGHTPGYDSEGLQITTTHATGILYYWSTHPDKSSNDSECADDRFGKMQHFELWMKDGTVEVGLEPTTAPNVYSKAMDEQDGSTHGQISHACNNAESAEAWWTANTDVGTARDTLNAQRSNRQNPSSTNVERAQYNFLSDTPLAAGLDIRSTAVASRYYCAMVRINKRPLGSGTGTLSTLVDGPSTGSDRGDWTNVLCIFVDASRTNTKACWNHHTSPNSVIAPGDYSNSHCRRP